MWHHLPCNPSLTHRVCPLSQGTGVHVFEVEVYYAEGKKEGNYGNNVVGIAPTSYFSSEYDRIDGVFVYPHKVDCGNHTGLRSRLDGGSPVQVEGASAGYHCRPRASNWHPRLTARAPPPRFRR